MTANAVVPTIVPTDMTEDVRGDPVYVEAKLASIPTARMVRISQVAFAVLGGWAATALFFLAGTMASWRWFGGSRSQPRHEVNDRSKSGSL